MRFESLFYNIRITKEHEKYQLTLAGFFALLAFGIIAGFYKDENYRSNSRRLARLIGRAINGLKNMEIIDVLIAGVASLAIGFVTILILDIMFQKRKIIVAFEMVPSNESVIFETKTPGNDRLKKMEFKFKEISFSNDRLKDGTSSEVFDCLVFKKNSQSIGILYLDHSMWNNIDSIELNNSIHNLKKQVNLV